MTITDQAQAILLLTAHLGKTGKSDPRPLGPVEWGRFAQWLHDRGIVPETLLRQDPGSILEGWIDPAITLERIRYLLGRAGALGLVMERWERAGLWVITRSDPEYPARLKRRLKTESPPFFFGAGNRGLLNRGGIAVVGSREASEEDLVFSSRLGAAAALEHLPVVSGGARGVDEAAMLGALELEGAVVGVLADNLLRSATSSKYRKGLMAGNLALISPFNPEAGFDVGNAMARNRYIYCLADVAIVIATGVGKGGTWHGATEDLRNRWVPLWVKPARDEESGNLALVRRGARWLPEADFKLSALFAPMEDQEAGGPKGLFDMETPSSETPAIPAPVPSVSDAPSPYHAEARIGELHSTGAANSADLDLYGPFLVRLERLTAGAPVTPEQLTEVLGITRSQAGVWLSRALEEGRVRKLNKPVRYEWRSGQVRQPSMFDGADS